ncbi:hypothetical protein D9M68_798840 [compost metagenome]
MQVDFGEHLGGFIGALGLEKSLATLHRLSGFFQDADHIEVAATAQTDQQHLHRAHTQVTSAALRRAVHHHDMAATGLAEKQGFARPLNARFHYQASAVKKGRSLSQRFLRPDWQPQAQSSLTRC